MERVGLFQENDKKMKSYVGYSTDADIRYRATSGGVGTSLIKWMFDKGIIETSVSFTFDAKSLRYVPKMIHSFSEYSICGSIYQEIDLVGFVKSHVEEIKGAFACFTLPCQARAVRAIVEKAGHEALIIGLTCSSQQTIDATKYLLKRVGIDESDVTRLQYRGNGWPSGIQIETSNGKKVFVPNSRSIWNKIFHSRLFIRQKCFMCKDTLNKHSDLSLADPWLKQFSDEKIGKTLVVCNTDMGNAVLCRCASDGGVNLDNIEYSEVVKSQKGTMLRKNSYAYSPNLMQKCRNVLGNETYRRIMLKPMFFQLHCRIKSRVEKFLLKKLQSK